MKKYKCVYGSTIECVVFDNMEANSVYNTLIANGFVFKGSGYGITIIDCGGFYRLRLEPFCGMMCEEVMITPFD
jgi:hypothetical protein